MSQTTATSLGEAKRIVVKIGSALLTDQSNGTLKRDWLKTLIQDIADMRARGQQVILVSSGAIALGRGRLGLPKGALKLEESQAAAAAGQIHLAQAFQDLLQNHEINCAQILLTLDDTETRRRYLNARSTIETLLKLGAVPLINENDTIATTEIRYGDNDRLAARVASMMSADCLVLLSDIDGLYTRPPLEDGAQHIARVEEITPAIEAMAGDAGSELSRGGMKTKIEAGKIAVGAGCSMVIGSGHVIHPLKAIEEGARATWFVAHSNPHTERKRWIAGHLQSLGTLHIDAGALNALEQGKSLLPAGITQVDGTFERGDAIAIVDAHAQEVARGLAAYSNTAATAIMGRNSNEIEQVLGYRGRAEMVHRDDLVLKKRTS
ncbi:MAG: glutamate 5-kinase [Rhodobiaceae bacterium]|nr:glutamate 5-kinase [Rhodobiaceae bacterium]